jgi:hypothetical protein
VEAREHRHHWFADGFEFEADELRDELRGLPVGRRGEVAFYEEARVIGSAEDFGVFGVVHVSVHVSFRTDVGV